MKILPSASDSSSTSWPSDRHQFLIFLSEVLSGGVPEVDEKPQGQDREVNGIGHDQRGVFDVEAVDQLEKYP